MIIMTICVLSERPKSRTRLPGIPGCRVPSFMPRPCLVWAGLGLGLLYCIRDG